MVTLDKLLPSPSCPVLDFASAISSILMNFNCSRAQYIDRRDPPEVGA